MIGARLLGRELERLDLDASDEVRAKLLQYVTALERWNRTINLTSLRGGDLVRRLVAEPLWIAQQLQLSGKLADIGSGNGSPGIPLAIVSNLGETHLVESRVKRAAFLRQMVIEVRLESVYVHNERVENLPAGVIPPVDWITLQAVRPEPSLLGALRALALSTTTVVWITSVQDPPVPHARRLAVPQSTTLSWLFEIASSGPGAGGCACGA